MEQRLQRKAIQFIVNTPNSTKAEKDEVFEEVIEELSLEERVALRASLKQTFKNKLKNFRFGLVESVCAESRKLGETEALTEERKTRIKELPMIKKYKLLSSADADFWEDLAGSQWRTTTKRVSKLNSTKRKATTATEKEPARKRKATTVETEPVRSAPRLAKRKNKRP